ARCLWCPADVAPLCCQPVAGPVLDAARQRQQRERAADRERDAEDRQRRANRPPPQIAQREADEVHWAASVAGSVSATGGSTTARGPLSPPTPPLPRPTPTPRAA